MILVIVLHTRNEKQLCKSTRVVCAVFVCFLLLLFVCLFCFIYLFIYFLFCFFCVVCVCVVFLGGGVITFKFTTRSVYLLWIFKKKHKILF